MGFYIESKPVVTVELEDIDVSIRKERNKLWDVEFETGISPVSVILDYMLAEKARGVEKWVTNL